MSDPTDHVLSLRRMAATASSTDRARDLTAAADELERLRAMEARYELILSHTGELMAARQAEWRENHRLEVEVERLGAEVGSLKSDRTFYEGRYKEAA